MILEKSDYPTERDWEIHNKFVNDEIDVMPGAVAYRCDLYKEFKAGTEDISITIRTGKKLKVFDLKTTKGRIEGLCNEIETSINDTLCLDEKVYERDF